ncbi:MAG: GntR family transcriptional regulator [Verrucomicrobia bacterium]|nr:MAG: GntR family transcriptional regulator [Verrucomicrobiota bacterium]
MLPFTIQIQLGEPIYEQIVRAVKKAVATGQLLPGAQMPSVRVISRELSVNPNTVQKAISRLTDEGVLASHPGSGSFVAERGPSPRAERLSALKPLIEQLLVESAHHGLTADELLELIRQHHQRNYGNDH